MNKIEQNELESLKAFSSEVRELKEEIADIEVSLARLNTKKQGALFQIQVAAEKLTNKQAELFEKYGNVKINLQTGEINNG